MNISISRGGIYVLFRPKTDNRSALGFVIKPVSKMLFSERHGGFRGVRIGPIYARTYRRSALDFAAGKPRT